jgi:hypothetical protein
MWQNKQKIELSYQFASTKTIIKKIPNYFLAGDINN